MERLASGTRIRTTLSALESGESTPYWEEGDTGTVVTPSDWEWMDGPNDQDAWVQFDGKPRVDDGLWNVPFSSLEVIG